MKKFMMFFFLGKYEECGWCQHIMAALKLLLEMCELYGVMWLLDNVCISGLCFYDLNFIYVFNIGELALVLAYNIQCCHLFVRLHGQKHYKEIWIK